MTILLKDAEGKLVKESTRLTWLIEAEPEPAGETAGRDRGGRDRGGRDRG